MSQLFSLGLDESTKDTPLTQISSITPTHVTNTLENGVLNIQEGLDVSTTSQPDNSSFEEVCFYDEFSGNKK